MKGNENLIVSVLFKDFHFEFFPPSNPLCLSKFRATMTIDVIARGLHFDYTALKIIKSIHTGALAAYSAHHALIMFPLMFAIGTHDFR